MRCYRSTPPSPIWRPRRASGSPRSFRAPASAPPFTARLEAGGQGGSKRIALTGDDRRNAGDGRRGTAPAAGAAGPGQGRDSGGVAPPPTRSPTDSNVNLCRNLKPVRRGRRIGPRSRPQLQRAQSMNRWLGFLAVVCLFPARAGAQDTTTVRRTDHRPRPADPAPTVTLSLQDALQQARANSPAYRQALNDAGPARWGVRNAYGSFLPTVNVAGDLGYIGSGQTNIGGGLVQPTSAFLTSGYSLGVNWQLDGRVLSGPGQQKALQQGHRGGHQRRRDQAPGRHHHPVPERAPGHRAGRRGPAAGGPQRGLPYPGAGALSGGTGDAARRAPGGSDQGPVATWPCSARSRRRTRRSWSCCAAWASSRRSRSSRSGSPIPSR